MALFDRKDASWVRRSFLVAQKDLEPGDFRRRTFSSAALKFTDTTPGGNICINPPPQFTRFADIKMKDPYSNSRGMGRYYSEAIDDNSQIIHMRFGVEEYNSLTTFFTGFYNSSAGELARTGRGDGAFYLLGKAVGYVVQLASWKLLAVHFLGVAYKFFVNKPRSKFYYLKPTMPVYWQAVQTMVNHIAVNRGIVPRVLNNPDSDKMNEGYQFDQAGIARLHKAMPDIINEKGIVDVYAVANRAKRKERQRMKALQNALDSAEAMGVEDISARIRAVYANPETFKNMKEPSFGDYLSRWFGMDQSKPKAEKDGTGVEGVDENKNGWEKFKEFLTAELDDGSSFASFRVNSTGPVSESFSSSTQESELQSKINGLSSQARSARFSFGNGNIVGGPLGDLIGGAVGAVKSFAGGILDSVELSGLASLAGSAFVDIPKVYANSIAQLPRASYTINLQSAYGNPISQMLNLDIPLAMLLAGALPKSTGKQTYTGPFLVELYDRGRCQTRLGMIDSLQITRGVGNVGFNTDGKALGIDVTFSVVDMSSILHMPLVEKFSLTQAAAQAAGKAVAGEAGQAVAAGVIGGGAFDEDTPFTDYMAILAGLSLPDQIYPLNKMKLGITRKMQDFNSWASISHMTSFLGDTFPGHLASAFYAGVTKK